ncbi:MAG: TRAP transporter small permease [Gammaproteobacteria bacterium]
MTASQRQPGFLTRADRAGQLIETTALVAVLTAMILLASAQIVMRNFFATGFAWADEALRLMVLWVAMLGAVAASRDNRHIAIDVMSRILPAGPRVVAALVVHVFTASVSFMLAWYSWQFVAESREFEDRLLNDLPAWWFQSILPVGFLLIGYRYLIWFLRGAREAIGKLFDGAGRR